VVEEPRKGSIEGRGRKDLLPERGNPFDDQESSSEHKLNPSADVFPIGLERAREKEMHTKDASEEAELTIPTIGPARDGGMHAVGPPYPEDLFESEMPRPAIEPVLPNPPDKEISSLILGGDAEREATILGRKQKTPAEETRHDQKSDSLLVSELRWKRLHAKGDLLRKRIDSELDNPHLKEMLLDQISIACEQRLSTREQFEESERILNEVEGRIHLDQEVQKWSASIKNWVLIYEIVFGLLFLAGLVLFPNILSGLISRWFPSLTSSVKSILSIMLNTMMWGGLGGVMSAFIGIWTHRALKQDIDRQWAIWFFANPFMGIVLGAVLFLLFRALLLGVFPISGANFRLWWVLYILSWIVGFKQNVFYDLVERISKLFEFRRGKA
jgi:hypothetical protein